MRDLLHSDDTERMLDALRILGVKVESLGDNAYRITGCGGNFPNKEAKLFLGNAGTAFRPLTAALALSGGSYELSGVPRMHERPIGDLVDALRQLGADIRYLGNEGFPPLQISPAKLAGDTVQVRGDVSSQFLTGLLMALPLLDRTVKVEVVGELISKPYIEITLAMMARFGVRCGAAGLAELCCVWQRQSLCIARKKFMLKVMLRPPRISLLPVRLVAGRCAWKAWARQRAGRCAFCRSTGEDGRADQHGDELDGGACAANGKLKAIDLDCNHIPDAAMTLAVAALFADGTTTLRNIASWRVKETDRIAAMATELRKVGATVEEGADYIRITPPAQIKHAAIDTYDDHRMAMCFSLAAFGGAGVRINDPKCVAKTFPEYFSEFAKVTQAVPVIAIDGPSASGKGTVAQRVATALGMHYLDSGALVPFAGAGRAKARHRAGGGRPDWRNWPGRSISALRVRIFGWMEPRWATNCAPRKRVRQPPK